MICANDKCLKETSNPKFCSRSCATVVSNKNNKKRKPNNPYLCTVCTLPTTRRRLFCEQCWSKNPSLQLTKEQALTNDTQKYRRIRSSARIIAKEKGLLDKCAICGYDKCVETCHIHPISDFKDSDLVSEINTVTNLIGLCPNHHWEFDNGHLTLPHLAQSSGRDH